METIGKDGNWTMERNEISEMETDWKGSGKYVSMERKVTKLEKIGTGWQLSYSIVGIPMNQTVLSVLWALSFLSIWNIRILWRQLHSNQWLRALFCRLSPFKLSLELSILVFHHFPYCFTAVFGVICHSLFDDSHCWSNVLEKTLLE